ncbi:MAG TPA: deoxyribose-phosphate aldolase [Anaeromyxobacteraceae bacterium]|nr:deoxyribose-phosphate aldolase [Anaeromyxobacteraceae bacterium]
MSTTTWTGRTGSRLAAPPAIRAPADLAPLIDHTLLKPDATADEVRALCAEAARWGFAGVCVRPEWVAEAARRLAGTKVHTVSVVDFPAGAGTTPARVAEALGAIACGAEEIDAVIALPALLGRDYRYVLLDLVELVGRAGVPVKVILETCRLSREQKAIGCALARAAGAAFVKTSTGFAEGGATAEDVALMRSVVGEEMGVKASGGIRTAADARRMVEAGADRLGASASVAIVTGGF